MREDSAPDAGAGLLAIYETALPVVYGYLLSRCGRSAGSGLAQDLTAETFLAAVDAVRRDPAAPVSAAWLVGIARHKLVDHWRRQAREARSLRVVAAEPAKATQAEDPWEAHLDALRAHTVLEALPPPQRAALTLRYLDDLPVSEVASLLGRSLHATEALLVRSRAAFRRAYSGSGEEAGRD